MAADIVIEDNRVILRGDVVCTGESGDDGDIFVNDKDGNATIHLGGEDSRIALGGHGNDGDVFVKGLPDKKDHLRWSKTTAEASNLPL